MIALALLLAQAPDTQRVNLPATVDDLPAVVATLAATSGAKLKVAPGLRKDVVGLAIPNRPLQEALDALATATDAKWTDRDGVLTLARTAELDRQRASRNLQNRIEALKPGLAYALQNIDPQPLTPERALATFNQHFTRKATDNGYETREIWMQTGGNFHLRRPAYQLSRRMIQNVGVAGFAALPEGTTVFSTEPTKLQLPFPSSPTDMMRRYVDELSIWGNLAASIAKDEPFAHSLRPNKGFSKGLLIVRKERGYLSFVSAAYDETGASYEQIHDSLHRLDPRQTSTYAAGDLPEFRLAPEAVALSKGQGPPAADLKRWQNPAVYEPLASIATAPLQALAQHRGHVVAANLSDQLLDPLLGNGALHQRLAPWMNELPRYGMTEIRGKDATIIQLKTPRDEDASRFDREAMAKYFANRGPLGEYRLQHHLDYAAADPSLAASMAMRYFAVTKLVPNFRAIRRPQWLVALATLTPQQRQTLDRKRVIPRRDLSPRQQQLFMALSQTHLAAPRELRLEPTEASLAADFQLSLNTHNESGWYRTTDLLPISVGQIAQVRHFGVQPGQAQSAPTPELYEGTLRQITVSVVFPDQSSVSESFDDPIVTTKKVPSASFSPEIEKQIMAIRKQLPASLGRRGGGSRIPPP